jgi:hypothetical protein
VHKRVLKPATIFSCKKIRRRDYLANIEVPCLGKLGEINVRMGFPLFVKKVLQYRFGIDANEFLSKSTIEEVNIARMNTQGYVKVPQVKQTKQE